MSEQKHKLSDYVSAEEIKQLKKTNNVMAVYLLLKNWMMATALFALVAVYPNVFTIIFTVVMLGGVQMAMGAFLHDCSHRAMFSNQKLNDVLGHWLGGLPVLVPMSFYRPYHFAHHTAKNESEDPDVQNIKNYPVTKSSMSRKIFRDVIGLSGLKSTIGVFLFVLTGRIGNSGAMGIKKNTPVSRGEILKTTFTNYRDVFILHGLVIVALIQLGHGELYGLWWAAMVFAQPLILRVRQIGEHGAMPELFHEDVRKTTRTTLPTWWEKFIFGPNFINFHHEHHLAATIPSYNYPKLNKMLQERGYYQGNEQALVKEGYMEVLRIASSKVA